MRESHALLVAVSRRIHGEKAPIASLVEKTACGCCCHEGIASRGVGMHYNETLRLMSST